MTNKGESFLYFNRGAALSPESIIASNRANKRVALAFLGYESAKKVLSELLLDKSIEEEQKTKITCILEELKNSTEHNSELFEEIKQILFEIEFYKLKRSIHETVKRVESLQVNGVDIVLDNVGIVFKPTQHGIF